MAGNSFELRYRRNFHGENPKLDWPGTPLNCDTGEIFTVKIRCGIGWELFGIADTGEIFTVKIQGENR